MKKYASTFVFFCLISTLTVALNGCGGSGGSGDPDNKDDAPKPAAGFNSEQTVGSLSFDFEHSSQSWSSYGVITSTSPNYARSGSSSLAITQRQANDYGTKRRIHQAGETLLQAGRTYIIRGYLKQPNASASLSRTYTLSTITGTSPDYTDISRILVNGSEWHLFRGYFMPNSDQLAQDISLLINSDGTEDFYLDDISLSETRYTPDHQGTPLKASGNQLVDAAGKSVRLRGINLIAYADDETETFERWQRHSYFNVDRQDFHDIKAMGFNSVRLAIWYHAFESNSAPGVWLESGFNWLNIMLGWAKEAGVSVVLDMHAPQG
ncbi:cellulase family glycosylhydrolase, partial [Oceanospirillum sp. HFRX-1_2]